MAALHTESGPRVLVSKDVQKDLEEEEKEDVRGIACAGWVRLPDLINDKVYIKSLEFLFFAHIFIPEILICLSQMRTWTLGL